MCKVKRMLILLALVGVTVCGCAPERSDSPPGDISPTQQGEEVSSSSSHVKAVGTSTSPIEYGLYDTVYTRGETFIFESDELIIPISSIEEGRSLECIVHVDEDIIHVSALTLNDKYLVWYGACKQCLVTDMATHPHVNYDGMECIACNGCGQIFLAADILNAGNNSRDLCTPLVISSEDYEVRKISECEINTHAYPWMNSSLEEDSGWGTPKISRNEIADKDAIVVPYSVLRRDIDELTAWYASAMGMDMPAPEQTGEE